MQAINGYLENGKFIPNEQITLTKRVKAVLVFSESEIENDERQEALNLFEQMRAKVVKDGDFMTDDEINAEIQVARAEKKTRNRHI